MVLAPLQIDVDAVSIHGADIGRHNRDGKTADVGISEREC
jgi:hypothetical protein